MKEKLYNSQNLLSKTEPVMLISAISLRPIAAYSGFEPIELKVSEIDTEFEVP